MKESKYSVDNRIVFRETFESEDSVRKNGGTPTAVTFSHGVASFNGTSSFIQYKNQLRGTYSIRIKVTPTSFSTLAVLIDFRNTSYVPTHRYIAISATTGILDCPLGTKYVNGIASTTTILNRLNDIVVTGMTIDMVTSIIYIGQNPNTAVKYTGTIELIELYSGTLTASEVANLYNSSFNMPAVPYSGQIIGTNILTNPSFDTDISGWSALRSTIEWKDGGYARVTKSDNGASSDFVFVKSGLTVNKKYLVKFKARSSLTTQRPYGYENVYFININWINRPYYTETWQEYSFYGESKTGNMGIWAVSSSVLDGVYVEIDDFVVNELRPNALMLFDATQGGLIDRSGLRTLTATDVITKR